MSTHHSSGRPLSLKVLALVSWEGSSLARNMEEHLTSLEELTLEMCDNILLLPILPESWGHRFLGGFSLPEGMACLEALALRNCDNIHSLPSLPLSFKKHEIYNCNSTLAESCLTEQHPSCHKFAHIKGKCISVCLAMEQSACNFVFSLFSSHPRCKRLSDTELGLLYQVLIFTRKWSSFLNNLLITCNILWPAGLPVKFLQFLCKSWLLCTVTLFASNTQCVEMVDTITSNYVWATIGF